MFKRFNQRQQALGLRVSGSFFGGHPLEAKHGIEANLLSQTSEPFSFVGHTGQGA